MFTCCFATTYCKILATLVSSWFRAQAGQVASLQLQCLRGRSVSLLTCSLRGMWASCVPSTNWPFTPAQRLRLNSFSDPACQLMLEIGVPILGCLMWVTLVQKRAVALILHSITLHLESYREKVVCNNYVLSEGRRGEPNEPESSKWVQQVPFPLAPALSYSLIAVAVLRKQAEEIYNWYSFFPL